MFHIITNNSYRSTFLISILTNIICSFYTLNFFNIDIFFGTYQSEKDRDITKPTIKNPKGIDEAQNLLLDSCYSTRAKGTYPQNGFERECTLVKYGKKFHPTKKYAVDLSDVTPSNKKRYLGKDRKWYLKIEGLFRDFIE